MKRRADLDVGDDECILETLLRDGFVLVLDVAVMGRGKEGLLTATVQDEGVAR